MKRREVTLTAAQQTELEQLRDQGAKACMRERAAAILKVAAGQAAQTVAMHGLLRRRDRHTVTTWLNGYQATGMAGLEIQTGRGRKAAFFLSVRSGGAGGRGAGD